MKWAVKWFGEPWPSEDLRAPVCADDADRVPPPLPWEPCLFCSNPFGAEAQGVMMPRITADYRTEMRYAHIECLLGNVGGHQTVCELRVEDDED